MRILLMGYGKWACLALRALKSAGHEIVGVLCETDECEAHRQEYYKKLDEIGLFESLINAAEENGAVILRYINTDSEAFLKKIEPLEIDLIVSCGWRRVLGSRLLSTYTCINVHGALLPAYRGRMPVAWAILNRETKTGVTVHFMTARLDEGDIICQESFGIADIDSVADVLRNGMILYPKLLVEAVMKISNKSVILTPQNSCSGSYWPRFSDIDGRVNWKHTSRDIHNLIRAQSIPYPGAYTFLKNRKIIINKSSFPSENHFVSPIIGIVFNRCAEGSVCVTTGDGYLVLNQISINGFTGPPSDRINMGSRFD